jgi:hypothetical protein
VSRVHAVLAELTEDDRRAWHLAGAALGIDGSPATRERVSDLAAFGHDLATFLRALQAIDTAEAPAAGR